MTRKNNLKVDKLGMCASAACMLHCLAVPIIFVFGLDATLWWIDQEWIEWSMIGLTLIIGLVSFLGGYRLHKQHFVPVLFLAGLLLMINGEHVGHEWIGITLSCIGASIVIYAHVHNYQLRRHVA